MLVVASVVGTIRPRHSAKTGLLSSMLTYCFLHLSCLPGKQFPMN
jgi:hypothetical protein